MLRIFLSHVRDDGVPARRLAEALKRAGHQPLLAEDVARVGESVLDVLERCLSEADVGVLCLSRAALADAWMQTEFQTALDRLEGRGRPVLAVRFERVLPQGAVAQKPAVDLLPEAGDWDQGTSTLLEVVRAIEKGHAGKGWPLLLGAPPAPEVFVDREEILGQLHEALDPRPDNPAERRATLVGAEGMGKTAIALRFAHDSRESFPGGIWWCEAQGRTPDEELVRLSWQIRRLAPLSVRTPLDSISPVATTEEFSKAVRRALEGGQQPSLLIVHDVAELNWDGHLPGGLVSVLMVRRQSQGAVGRQIIVGPLPSSAALELIDALTLPPAEPQEREAQLRLVRDLLGGVPLAVTLIAQSQSGGVPWSEVEQAWRAQLQQMGSSGGLEHLVALDAVLSRCTPTMRRLLVIVATFAAAPVPADWVSAWAEDNEERLRFNRAVRELLALGLITWHGEPGALSLHPLVRKRVREQTEAAERERLLQKDLEVMESWLRPRIPLLRPERVAGLEAYLPHLLDGLEATSLQPPSEAWIRLAVEVSGILKFRSQYSTALELLERALSQAERLQSSLHQLNCLVELAVILHEMGWEQRAGPYIQRALSVVDELSEKPTEGFINSLNKLAVLLGRKDAGRARQLAEQAFQMAEALLGAGNERTAILLGNLAKVTAMAEGAAAAIPLYRRALETVEQRLGKESSYVAQLASGLALALSYVGDLAGARELMEKAVAIDERLLPPDHPEAAKRLMSLAVVLMRMGEFASARPLLERAAAIEEAKLGPDHPGLTYTLHNLGSALLELGKAQEAEVILSRAAALAEAGLPPDHPLRADTSMALAAVASRLGDRRAAALHLERALDAGMTLYAPDPGHGRALLERALKLAHGRQVNPEAYVSALTEALAVAEQGGDTENAAKAALLLGSFEGRRGAWETARRHIERGLRLAKQAESPLLIAESHRLLGDASLHGSRYEDARLHYAEAIRRWEDLGLASRASRARMLLSAMMLQLGRTEGLEEQAAALEKALKEGTVTDPAERTEVEQILRLIDAARQGTSPEQRGNTE